MEPDDDGEDWVAQELVNARAELARLRGENERLEAEACDLEGCATRAHIRLAAAERVIEAAKALLRCSYLQSGEHCVCNGGHFNELGCAIDAYDAVREKKS